MKTIAEKYKDYIDKAWQGVEMHPEQKRSVEMVFYSAWWSALNTMIEVTEELDEVEAMEEMERLHKECKNWVSMSILNLQVGELFRC